MADRLLRIRPVAERVGLGVTTIYRMIRNGQFPRGRQISGNTVGWLESELDAWIVSREVTEPAGVSGSKRAKANASVGE